jgi:hypothetical protein
MGNGSNAELRVIHGRVTELNPPKHKEKTQGRKLKGSKPSTGCSKNSAK